MNEKLIEMFNAEIANPENFINFTEVNTIALKHGYIVEPAACSMDVLNFIESQSINPNATFYKSWNDIVNKDRLTLFLDQILHYTFGFVSNDRDYSDVPPLEEDITKYTVIRAVDVKEIFDRCLEMVNSGIAIKSDIVEVICEFLAETTVKEHYKIDIDLIANREAQVVLCNYLGTMPRDKFNLMRYILYKTTCNSLVIKNKEMIRLITEQGQPFHFSSLDEGAITRLSTIFYRYKDLILAFKHNPNSTAEDRAVINRMARLARKTHTPMETPFWNALLIDLPDVKEVKERVSELNNFELISLCQAIRYRFICHTKQDSPNFYQVRNGKMYIDNKHSQALSPEQERRYLAYFGILIKQLSERLRAKYAGRAVVKYPDYHLTCPTSEKNFVGNIPQGSYYNLNGENFMGIYWRGEWGTQDFDLSFLNTVGGKIGWNSHYYDDNGDIIFSGDMVVASPEAAEVLYCSKKTPDGLIYVNRYNGEVGSKFKIFFGSQPMTEQDFDFPEGYIVDPNCIKMTTEATSNLREQMVGLVYDSKVYMVDIQCGDARVSSKNREGLYKAFAYKAISALPLKDTLENAGIEEFDETAEYPENMEIIDLTNLSKDTIINIFA